MKSPRCIPFHDLIERARKRHAKLVNNYRGVAKVTRFGYPCTVRADSILCIELQKKLAISTDFASLLLEHKEYLRVYWPKNGDVNDITVMIDSKHHRKLFNLYHEHEKIGAHNESLVLCNAGDLTLSLANIMKVGDWVFVKEVGAGSVGYLRPSANHKPTLYHVHQPTVNKFEGCKVIKAEPNIWYIVSTDENGETKSTVIGDRGIPIRYYNALTN